MSPTTSRRPRPGRLARGALLAVALTAAALPGPAAVPALAVGSSVTVDALRAAADEATGASVTVSQTRDLVYQTVRVSWRGFRPSDPPRPVGGASSNATRTVLVLQCSAQPRTPSDCNTGRATDVEGDQPVPVDGTDNERVVATLADGTPGGSVDMEIRTRRELPRLGCSAARGCSLVVVPNYGDPTQPDLDFIFATDAFGLYSWAWQRRVVVPLSFAPSADACPLKDAQLSVTGSFVAARAVTSWQAQACVRRTAPIAMTYSALGEPIARANFLGGGAGATDVALTTRPAQQQGSRPFTYVPIAVTGIAVAYRNDLVEADGSPGVQAPTMTLNARLVAKLLSASYDWTATAPLTPDERKRCVVVPRWVKDDQSPPLCPNPATQGNPVNVFSDPEFLALNPLPDGRTWQERAEPPLIMLDNSDLVYELTRWVDADPEARAFLDGARDPWGMTVNPAYRGIDYPVDRFELRDPFARLGLVYQPVVGLEATVRGLVDARPSGRDLTPQVDNLPFPGRPVQANGTRSLIAFIDTADAEALDLPVAKLVTGDGHAVGPTTASMAAAVAAMTVNRDGVTRQVDHTRHLPDAYPLTMVVSAMAPTAGLGTRTAAVADFLRLATSSGQLYGTGAGDLPAGYVSLPDPLRAQAADAVEKVAAQRGTSAGSAGPVRTPSAGGAPPTAGPAPAAALPPLADGSLPSASPLPAAGPLSPAPTGAPAAQSLTALPAGATVRTSSPTWVRLALPGALGGALLFGGLASAFLLRRWTTA